MLTLLSFVLLAAIIEHTLRPRLEKGRGGWILWYGYGTKRKYFRF